MKLATLKNNTLDGQLCVVSKDLSKAVLVPQIAPTMQLAIESWQKTQPLLQEMYEALNQGTVEGEFSFDQTKAHSPLPRAYQWADGSAYVNHVELVRKARNAEMPANFWTDPLMYQGGSDTFLGPRDEIPVEDLDFGVDFEAEIAVITHQVPCAASVEQAKDSIALFMLCNDVSLRNLIPNEIAKGFGFFNSKPSSAFSPVAITPDEFGESFDGLKVHLPLQSELNGKIFGQPNAGVDMTFDFPTLVAHAAKTRGLSAGTIIGSGTVSNVDRSKGSSCIAEKRMLEIIQDGKAATSFMQYGDTIKIQMFDKDQNSLFGAIDQTVVPLKK